MSLLLYSLRRPLISGLSLLSQNWHNHETTPDRSKTFVIESFIATKYFYHLFTLILFTKYKHSENVIKWKLNIFSTIFCINSITFQPCCQGSEWLLFRCSFCQSLAPVWAELAKKYTNQRSSVAIASVSCVSSPHLCSKNDVTIIWFLSLLFNLFRKR